MTTDRELLERAAKAAGMRIVGWCEDKPFIPLGLLSNREWNPLTNDGDALRLAVSLRMDITFENGLVNTLTQENTGASEMPGDDLGASTRRAIVRAAAEMSP